MRIGISGLLFGSFLSLFLAPFSAIAAANLCHQHGMHIADAEIRATPPKAPVTGGYVQIHNMGSTAQRLIAVEAEFSRHTELHEMLHKDGVMKMSPLEDGIEIAAGQKVQLKPGGLHIMFMHLTEQLKPETTHNLNLIFDKCGAMPVLFEVTKTPAEGQAHKHQH